MPLVNLHSSKKVDETLRLILLKEISAYTAEALGKSENYVMVALAPPVPMLFAGSNEPTAYLELKSIGLPEPRTAELSKTLCHLMTELNISQNRVYIEFTDAPRAMWGWDGKTF